MNEEMLAQLQQLPPEQRQQIMNNLFQDYMGKRDAIGDEQQLASQVMQGGSADGIRAGNQYVAASPLSHLSNALMKGMGGMKFMEGVDKKKELSEMYGTGLQGIAGTYLNDGKDPRSKKLREQRYYGGNQNLPVGGTMPSNYS